METIKKKVYDDVMYELRMFHCINTDDNEVIRLVEKYIEEHYNESLISQENIEMLVFDVVYDVVEDLKYIAYLKSQGKYKERLGDL